MCPYRPFKQASPCGSGQSEETEDCNVNPCLPDPEWSDWSEWTECSQTCGAGITTRTRRCECPPPKGLGSPCWHTSAGHQNSPCLETTCPRNQGIIIPYPIDLIILKIKRKY